MATALQTEPRSIMPAPAAAQPRVSCVRAVVKASIAAMLIMFLAETLRIFVGSNFNCVVPGRCYRAAQPTAEFLANVQRTHGIRAILNLRDENEDEIWYRAEKDTAQKLGIQLLNAGLCGVEQTPADDFRRFMDALDSCPEPMLIHCANGNDRSGLASVLFLLLRTDTPIKEARKHLSLRYGHFACSRASCLHRMLDSYEIWLQETHGGVHSADRLRYWAHHIYCPEPRLTLQKAAHP